MSSPCPDSLDSLCSTSATSGGDESQDQSNTSHADAEYVIDDESWSGDVHYAFVLHGVAIIPDQIIDGKPFLRLKYKLPFAKTLFKLKTYRYWYLSKTSTFTKLKAALWKQHRAAKHSRSIWRLDKSGAPVDNVVAVEIDGVKMDMTSNVKELSIRLSRTSLVWLYENLKADYEAGTFFQTAEADDNDGEADEEERDEDDQTGVKFTAHELGNLKQYGVTLQQSKKRLRLGPSMYMSLRQLKSDRRSAAEFKDNIISDAQQAACAHKDAVAAAVDQATE